MTMVYSLTGCFFTKVGRNEEDYRIESYDELKPVNKE